MLANSENTASFIVANEIIFFRRNEGGNNANCEWVNKKVQASMGRSSGLEKSVKFNAGWRRHAEQFVLPQTILADIKRYKLLHNLNYRQRQNFIRILWCASWKNFEIIKARYRVCQDISFLLPCMQYCTKRILPHYNTSDFNRTLTHLATLLCKLVIKKINSVDKCVVYLYKA